MKNYKYPQETIRRKFKELSVTSKSLYEDRLNYLLGLFAGLLFSRVISAYTFDRLSRLAMKTRLKIISLR